MCVLLFDQLAELSLSPIRLTPRRKKHKSRVKTYITKFSGVDSWTRVDIANQMQTKSKIS